MNRKYSAEEISRRLQPYCVDETEIEERISNVTEIVEMRIMATITERTPDNVKQFLVGKSPEEIGAYFAEHPEHIGMITTEEIFDIEDRTWDDYFETIEQ